ncbi:MAG: YkgJ family cysteine cluster protein [Planctomycetes bacterium]|nr:YkgJ family cysteine cluster protein [Planctomycetota bacterium]MBI3835764.1 YkgJ family cysteine cluster protein [Planctomycetota bacterium]
MGHLFDNERRFIQAQSWPELGVEPVAFAHGRWLLNKRPDGACVFLDDQNRCRIHTRFGEARKPIACRMFPFSIRPVTGGWQASLRFDCPSVISSNGEPLWRHKSWLSDLAQRLPRGREMRDRTRLQSRLTGTPEELDAITARFSRLFEDASNLLDMRLRIAAKATATLRQAKLVNVRGNRFAELLDLIVTGMASDVTKIPDRPTPRQSGMLRQLAFAHAEHVTLQELQAGWWGSARKRFQQLRRARAFLRGTRTVPLRTDGGGSPTFETVDTIVPDTTTNKLVSELISRYIITRLAGRSVFGAGYYDWPVLDGLDALWLSISCVGWFSRFFAACRARERFEFSDVAKALGVVDRAVTRLPALGTRSERARILYLALDDGPARLLNKYALTT